MKQDRGTGGAAATSSQAGNHAASSDHTTSSTQISESAASIEAAGQASSSRHSESSSLLASRERTQTNRQEQQQQQANDMGDERQDEEAASQEADASGEAEAGRKLPEYAQVLGAWVCLTGQVYCTHSPIRSAQLELPAKDPRFIETINKVGCREQFLGLGPLTPHLLLQMHMSKLPYLGLCESPPS
jgi:hypothetical protein